MQSRGTLTAFSIPSSAGTSVLEKLLILFDSSQVTMMHSSVYSRKFKSGTCIIGVIYGRTDFGVHDYHRQIEIIENQLNMQFQSVLQEEKIELTLLCYENFLNMTPNLNLPHPDLQADPLLIRCSAEVWPEYEHPVFQKSMREHAIDTRRVVECEFLLPSKKFH